MTFEFVSFIPPFQIPRYGSTYTTQGLSRFAAAIREKKEKHNTNLDPELRTEKILSSGKSSILESKIYVFSKN